MRSPSLMVLKVFTTKYMAKDFNFAKFLEELQSPENQVKAREVEFLNERKYFLIVTEGEKTEPLYFEYFRDKLPKDFLDTIHLIGEGANTVTVVEKAIRLRNDRIDNPLLPNFDEAWAVFDRDGFTPQRVNESILLANREQINLGFSNQAFELWYILHFQYLDADLDRSQYSGILAKCLKMEYRKNDPEIVRLVNEKGDVKKAIQRAERLCKVFNHQYTHSNAPLTTVHKLVEKLLSYCNIM